MRVFDCFTFSNEMDLLLLRLMELYNVVDHFVIVEADRTFTNEPKPLYFHECRKRFAPFLNKIIHVVVQDMPGGEDPWVRERFQRNAILRGLPTLDPMDVVIISDVDEIQRPETIATMRMTRYQFYGLRMPDSYFKLNFVNILSHNVTTVAVRPPLAYSPDQIHGLRAILNRPGAMAEYAQVATLLCHAGWHFSYLGDRDFVRKKIMSFSHQEYNTPEFLDSIDIDRLVSDGKDLFSRKPSRWQVVRFDDYFPRFARLIPEFQRWVATDPTARSLARDPEERLRLLP